MCSNEIRNIYSCRERKEECFERKINPERISLDKDVSKILRGSLFLGHRLLEVRSMMFPPCANVNIQWTAFHLTNIDILRGKRHYSTNGILIGKCELPTEEILLSRRNFRFLN